MAIGQAKQDPDLPRSASNVFEPILHPDQAFFHTSKSQEIMRNNKDTSFNRWGFHFFCRYSMTPPSFRSILRLTRSRGFCAMSCTRDHAWLVWGCNSMTTLSGNLACSSSFLSTIYTTKILQIQWQIPPVTWPAHLPFYLQYKQQ